MDYFINLITFHHLLTFIFVVTNIYDTAILIWLYFCSRLQACFSNHFNCSANVKSATVNTYLYNALVLRLEILLKTWKFDIFDHVTGHVTKGCNPSWKILLHNIKDNWVICGKRFGKAAQSYFGGKLCKLPNDVSC